MIKASVFISIVGNYTVKINTMYIAQKSFDLRAIPPTSKSGKYIIDLINVKLVKEEYQDQYPFVARVWRGDGSLADPFVLGIEGRNTKDSNMFMDLVNRGESKKFELNY